MSQIDHTSLFDLALVNLLMFWGHDQMFTIWQLWFCITFYFLHFGENLIRHHLRIK